MLLKIALALVVVLAALAVFIASRPSEFRVSRSLALNAPPSVLFQEVNDLHRFQEWNPFSCKDPAIQNTYSGPASGVGAKMAWVGNREVGEGSMTNLETRPNEYIRFALDFVRPFEGHNIAEFTFVPQGAQTVVTWNMSGRSNFMFKAMGLFMDCDKMCGGEFEKGLATLKAKTETTSTGLRHETPALATAE